MANRSQPQISPASSSSARAIRCSRRADANPGRWPSDNLPATILAILRAPHDNLQTVRATVLRAASVFDAVPSATACRELPPPRSSGLGFARQLGPS